MKSLTISVDVESVSINIKGEIVANVQIKSKGGYIQSRVINITDVLKEDPPKWWNQWTVNGLKKRKFALVGYLMIFARGMIKMENSEYPTKKLHNEIDHILDLWKEWYVIGIGRNRETKQITIQLTEKREPND